MATVYLAHDPRFGRNVALKVMSNAYRDDPTFRGRFEREARIVATLEHPAIVPVYDFGEDHDSLYLVMRYMPGGSLADRIVLKRFTMEEALPIVRRIASALDHAHSQGVIHRDLKPANILFDQYDNAFLSDFGIVKVVAETTTGFTGSGVIGTPAYMSPEQIHGDRELDGRSDLYTLGIILFEMITGVKPYRAETPVKQMMAHVLNPVPSIRDYRPELPPAYDEFVQKALAKEREGRFANGEEMTQALTLTASGMHMPPYLSTSPADNLQQIPLASLAANNEAETAVSDRELPTITDVLAGQAIENSNDEDYATPAAGAAADDGAAPDRRPPWQWLAAGGAAVLLLVISWLIFWPDQQQPAETATATSEQMAAAISSPTPTATVTPTRTPTATPTRRASATPTPSVTPQPLATLEIGRSLNDEPIEVYRIGVGSRAVLLVGGINAGYAPGSVDVARQAAAYFEDNLDQIPAGVTLYVLPNLNPDSEDAPGELAGRLNANGVDLNRNWDCRWRADPVWRGIRGDGLGGEAPFSEPEVAALRDFIMQVEPAAVVFWQARVFGGLVSPGSCDTAPQASEPLAIAYGDGSGYNVASFEELAGQEVNGDAPNWLDAQGIAAVSVLLPDYGSADFENNLAGITAVLQWVGGDS